MKQLLLLIGLVLFTVLISCTKENAAQVCGKVMSSRLCGVCSNQPAYIIDVQLPNGTTAGYEVKRDYVKGEMYCTE